MSESGRNDSILIRTLKWNTSVPFFFASAKELAKTRRQINAKIPVFLVFMFRSLSVAEGRGKISCPSHLSTQGSHIFQGLHALTVFAGISRSPRSLAHLPPSEKDEAAPVGPVESALRLARSRC